MTVMSANWTDLSGSSHVVRGRRLLHPGSGLLGSVGDQRGHNFLALHARLAYNIRWLRTFRLAPDLDNVPTDHACDGDDVLRPASNQVVEPGAVGVAAVSDG